jgi:hypothetical protein
LAFFTVGKSLKTLSTRSTPSLARCGWPAYDELSAISHPPASLRG